MEKGINKSSKEKKILLISHELSNTGAPILCRNISAELKRMGYSTVIISLCKGKVTHKFLESADEIKVVNIRHSYIKKALRMINPKWGREKSSRLNHLIKHYWRKGYKKAIVNSMESGSIVPYMKKNGYEIITLVHEMKSVYERFNAYDKLENISQYSDYVVFPGNAVKNDFLEASGKEIKGKICMIPQGLYKKQTNICNHETARQKLNDIFMADEESKYLVCSGAFAIIKGVDFAPLILNRLREHKELHLIWMGEIIKDPYSVAVINQIKRMGMEKRIHFTGFIDDEEKYNNILCGSEAFLLLSREDPMPSVMAEAIAMKLPVVAFKGSGGAEELLGEGRGILAEYCDINDICDKIELILTKKINIDNIKNDAYTYLNKNLVFKDYVEKLVNLFD